MIAPGPLALLEGPNICIVGSLTKDGQPSTNPAWVSTDGEHVLLNSSEGRGWPRNLQNDVRVSCTVINHENIYEYVTFWGRVTERTFEGAEEHIHQLAKKYLGLDRYPYLLPGEQRVTLKITPDRFYHLQSQGEPPARTDL
jgi:PPOX class probable F420-dependent enzyme